MKYQQVERASPEEVADNYRKEILHIAEKEKEIKHKLRSKRNLF